MEHSIVLQKDQTAELNQGVKVTKVSKPDSMGKKIINETTLSIMGVMAFGLFLFAVGLSLWIILPTCLMISGYFVWVKWTKGFSIDVSLDDSVTSAVEKDLFSNQA